MSCRKGWALYWALKGHNVWAVVQEAGKKQKVDTSVPLKTSGSGTGWKPEMRGYRRNDTESFVVVRFKFDTMMDSEDRVKFAKRIVVRYPLAVATGDLRHIEGLTAKAYLAGRSSELNTRTPLRQF
jgi:hypothetical protein